MRRVSFLLILLLLLAACTTSDDSSDEVDEPTPEPTAAVDDTPPEPTPDPTATEEPTPEPSPTATAEPDDENISIDLDAFVDEVVENVVELRGLDMLEELQFDVMSRDELTEMLEDETAVEQADIDLYWIMRLIDDRELDLEQLMVDAQAADIYGFYDPETQETYIIAEDDDLSAMEEVFLAHEITHALQDQHFSLDLLNNEDGDYDRMTAFLAMVEGDAVLTQELYAQAYLDADQQMEYQREAMSAMLNEDANAALDALPPYIIESLSFPYVAGPMFMLQSFDGELDSLNEHLENPPVSTQQVMNPSAYLNGEIADPVDVEFPESLNEPGDDWNLYDEGTIGVFDLTIMFEENGVADPDDVMEAWNGSRFVMYENGEDVILVLTSQWADDTAAADFESLLVETMADYSQEDGVWLGEGRFHTILSEGDTVTLTSSSNEEALLSIVQ